MRGVGELGAQHESEGLANQWRVLQLMTNEMRDYLDGAPGPLQGPGDHALAPGDAQVQEGGGGGVSLDQDSSEASHIGGGLENSVQKVN